MAIDDERDCDNGTVCTRRRHLPYAGERTSEPRHGRARAFPRPDSPIGLLRGEAG